MLSQAPVPSSPPTTETLLPLHLLLDEKAFRLPDQVAFRFLSDGETEQKLLTYSTLARRSKRIAAGLVARGLTGKPVLLAHRPGLDFIEGLFGCWYAGAIAVPVYPPNGRRHRERYLAVSVDCGAKVALGDESTRGFDHVERLELDASQTDGLSSTDSYPDFPGPALLQYTSGSTAAPKGVMISHHNFRNHFASLEPYNGLALQSALSWLPPYHDMGLVLKILYSLEAGIPLTFFAPEHFIQRPARWLRAISRYRAELSGAPNFAFEMCLRSIRDEEIEGLDLSCWRAAPCGAERIRQETLDRFSKRFAPYGFRADAFLPGYGLAETTLIVTACPPGSPPPVSSLPNTGPLVSSGLPLRGVNLRILNPESGKPCGEREPGEIRVKGPVVSQGYWKQPEATTATFGSETDGYLRTGDLGYLENGHLFVTGRIKDLIIIDGANHAPEDIEATIFAHIPEATAAAAFAGFSGGQEGVVVAIEAESLSKDQYGALCTKIRRAISQNLELPVQQVLLFRSGLLPRTTSGKIRRSACRDALAQGTLKFTFSDVARPVKPSNTGPQSGLLGPILDAVTEVTGRHGVRPEDDVISFGMSSIETTRLSALIETRCGRRVSISDLFSAGSFLELCGLLESVPDEQPSLPVFEKGSGKDSNILTHSQERMWFLHQLDPQSAAYHVFGSLEMTGDLDVSALDSAVAIVLKRHDILNSRHGIADGKPRVWIVEERMPKLESIRTASEKALREALVVFSRQPFRLDCEPPVRICLIEEGGRHVLGVCAHHIAADGWSLRLLVKEISAFYRAIREDSALPDFPSSSYLDYAACHRRWIDGGAVDKQTDYWRSRLAGNSGVLPLSTDFPRPNRPSSDGGAIKATVPADLCGRVADLARETRSTPFMVHLAVFLLVLRRHGAGDDPVVAVPVANRNHAAAANLIGTLVNTLPFRLALDPSEDFLHLLERVRHATFEMQANQDAPFEKIIEAVKPERSREHSPLAQVMFDHQEIPIAETWSGDLKCRPYMAHRSAVQFDLSLLLVVLQDRQQLTIEYRSDLFLAETAAAILDRYLITLEAACESPDNAVSSLAALTKKDEQRLDEISNGPRRPDFLLQTTPSMIAARAALHPLRTAFRHEENSIDYGTLARLSDNLATRLGERGVKPGARVALIVDRDWTLPVAMLAIWKCGAAYVPLDPMNPPERLKLILQDQEPLHILASPSLEKRIPSTSGVILFDESLLADITAAPHARISPADTAYVIYTSGSTGKPKGVVVSHGALGNFLLSMAETPGFTEADHLLAVTTISFDISALEIFLPLITGGSFELLSAETARDAVTLLEKLRSSRTTVMQATPATWRMLLDAGWQGSPDLKILCGGEALDAALAVPLRKMSYQLWNLYGPTETTIWSTLWQVPENAQSVRIGRPIANTGVHVLASDGSPLPPGVTGELWISGAGLSDGYWNRPDRTAASFVNGRYQTGDLARWCEDGSLECLGRSDSQVKIRGFRVELGEIEAALAAHPLVSQAKMTVRGADESSRKIIGWFTVASAEATPTTSELRNFLADRLPRYMLPADLAQIDEFPLNSNGKVDVARIAVTETFEESGIPETPTEIRLASIWCELLQKTRIHRNDDWFHVGGHSLLALRLFSRIHQEFDLSIPLSAIMEFPTLSSFASTIDERLQKRNLKID